MFVYVNTPNNEHYNIVHLDCYHCSDEFMAKDSKRNCDITSSPLKWDIQKDSEKDSEKRKDRI